MVLTKGYICLILIFNVVACKSLSQNSLILKRIEIDKNIEIDTISRYNNDSLLLVNINIFQGPVGDFIPYCGFIRNFGSKNVIYKAEDFRPYRTSNEFIAEIKPDFYSKLNWGWYYINDKREFDSLPNEHKIYDSITLQYPRDCFVFKNSQGYFWVNKDGVTIHEYEYGNIILNDSTIIFDRLSYGLYKIENNKLIKISNNPNELDKKNEGIYYVPRPGIGVKRKYKITEIDSLLMSYRISDDCPDEIRIEESK